MRQELPYGEGTLTAEIPDRRRFAFHPVHAVMAVYPLKRLSHVGRVVVAAPGDPAIPRHVGFETTPTVEEALARAETIHGRECAVAYIQQAPLPSALPRA